MRFTDMLKRHRGERVTLFLTGGGRIIGTLQSVACDGICLTDASYPTCSDEWAEEQAETFAETLIEFINIVSINGEKRIEPPADIEVQIGASLITSTDELRSRISTLRDMLLRQQDIELPMVRIRNNNSLDPFAIVVRSDSEYIPQRTKTAEEAIDVVCAVLRTISDRVMT